MSTNPNFGFGAGGFGAGTYGNPPIEYQPLGYYTGLVTSEYQMAAKLLAWLNAPLSVLNDASYALASFVTNFDLDGAGGAQLDILGQLTGASRTVGFQPSNGVSPVLDDTTYRLFLKARIAQNQWDGTIDSLQSIWQSLFPGGSIAIDDTQNMAATIILSGAFSSIIEDLILNGYIVPRPEGVLYNYVFGQLPAFGFNANNQYISGLDGGHWN